MDWEKFAYIKEGTLYLKGFLSYADRPLCEVEADELENTVEAYINKFNEAQEMTFSLQRKIEQASNKGAYLMRLRKDREIILNHPSIGDFTSLALLLDQMEEYLEDIIHENRVRNLHLKETLLQELEAVEEHFVGWKDATQKVVAIKHRWIRTGPVPEDRPEIEERFEQRLNEFFEKRDAFFQDQKEMHAENTERLETILDEAESLLKEAASTMPRERYKVLQKQWKSIGFVPPEIYQRLLTRFKEIGNQLFDNSQPLPAKTKSASNTGDVSFAHKETLEKYLQETDKQLATVTLATPHEIKELKQQIRQIPVHSNPGMKAIKNKLIENLSVMNEWIFVQSLCKKKYRSYANLSEENKRKKETEVAYALLERDRDELKNYRENAEKFSASEEVFNKLVGNKLKIQERKVAVKEQLYQRLKKRSERTKT